MDDIESLFFVIVLVVIGGRWFTTSNRFAELRRLVEAQAREIANLKRAVAALEERPLIVTAPEAKTAEPEAQVAVVEQPTAPIAPPAVEHDHIPIAPPPEAAPAPMRPLAEPQPPKIKPKQIEQQFGSRAFVWIGGVALALAGFYLVKYSIDTGLLTEPVRVTLGLLFGVVLLGASCLVRARGERIANGARIGQALAGAGIADLYGSLFAATTLYHLVPPWLGFGAMAATTAVAMVLSLRHGVSIALLGLVGGYATPAMVEESRNAPLLFGYLYLVFIGLSVVARGKNWWWMSVPATLVAFAWVTLWLVGSSASQDAAWLSTFLLAIGITAAMIAPRRPEGEVVNIAAPETWARFVAPAGAIVLAGVVAYTANFGYFEWGMFGLFSLGAIGLAVFDGRTYLAVPWIAMAVNLMMLGGWNGTPNDVALILSAFALIFCASGQLFLSRSHQPLSWAGLSAVAAISYFLLAYDKLNWPLAEALKGNIWLTASATWAAIAFAGAIAMTSAAARPFVLSREIGLRHNLQAIFAIAATGLLSLGLAILLHEEHLSFAIAVEILAISWLRTRVDVPALRYLSYVLTAQFALLLLPDAAQMLAEAGGIAGPSGGNRWDIVSTALFRYGAPALLFGAACQFLRDQKDEYYATGLELGAVALLTVTIYKLIQVMFFGHPVEATLVIGSIFTNILLAASIAAFRIARLWPNQARLLWGALALGAMGLIRVVILEGLVFDPLWSHQTVGSLPVLNGLLPVLVLPAILINVIGAELKKTRFALYAIGPSAAAYLLGFIWLSLAVRQVFNGAYLDSGTISNAEVYAYSAVWLALGVALLFGATLRKDPTMRYASLVVMILTVGKVFLYDASQLTGLWRVVSFLGLGLSLLGLSWFYSRFIFASAPPETATEETP